MKAYYEDTAAGITIYHGDCREVLPALRGVGFIWTDPPYNVGKNYGGVWNDAVPEEEHLAFIREWVGVAKTASPLLSVYAPTKYLPVYWRELGNDYRQIVMTVSPAGAIRYGFSNQFASILTNAKPRKLIPNVWHNCQMPALGYFFREQTYGHPGYTSEDITNRVLSNICPDGALVAEPFCGTGTTLVVAKRNGLRAVGCEVNERYCEIAAKRLAQGVLFGAGGAA